MSVRFTAAHAVQETEGRRRMREKTQIMNDMQVVRSITRIAHEIIERNRGLEDVCLVGIRTRGEPISGMIAQAMKNVEGVQVPVGSVDITFYRDDLSHVSAEPRLNRTDIPFDIEGKTVVLVDDVLYTGRTVRAAIEALMDAGRARCIQLAVLIDRGHRELPIRADFVGKNIPTSQREFVRVNMQEVDGETGVWLFDKEDDG